MSLGEFDLIARYFSRPTRRTDVLLGVGDDAALLAPPPGQAVVAATDTLVEGRHFLPGTPPESIGHQALAVNLSDLAAMGADPAWALLSLATPAVDETWLERFAAGLHALADRYGVALVGGDTVRGPLVVTVEVLGLVTPAEALRRSGARPGDRLFVSGTPGVAAAGLDLLARGALPFSADDERVRRCLYAEPRIELGRALRNQATAAMDVSDGLLGDLAKLCAASGVGARVELDALPIAPVLASHHDRGSCERFVLHGGDDYELLFAVPPERVHAVEAAAQRAACPITCIGEFTVDTAVVVVRGKHVESVHGSGYDHFAA